MISGRTEKMVHNFLFVFLLLKRNEIGKSLGFEQPFWDPMDCCLPGSSIHGIFKENSLMELLELLRRKLIAMKFLKSY